MTAAVTSHQQGGTSAVTMSQLGTVYATKRRRRNGKSLKPPPKDGVTKSNPSKRHRERLNAELDTLASLLPFEQNILSKLDRLSILRLSVSYLRTKSYFQVVMHKEKEDSMHPSAMPLAHSHEGFRNRDLTTFDHTPLDGDMFLQALNGFLMILTCEGEVFFATHSIESYLGFHQSDIVHQSVYELVHSEDREELQRQLLWNSFLGSSHQSGSPPHIGGHGGLHQDHGGLTQGGGMALAEALQPHNCHLLERSFTVRFRCLLDNTSGFLRLDIRGRVKALHGQNRKTEEPPLGLFALCTPFGPPSLLEVPQKEVMFKSKHKLDLALVSMDQRGKMLLGYSDGELANMGGYDLVHFDDLAYVASAHQELLKTGASGMIAYRFQTKDGSWQWLQTSSRLVYKNSKPDFVISTHRPLMEEEGRDLLGKRTMDFKVSYLDAGLTNSYFTDQDQLTSILPASTSPASIQPAPQRVNRRYKTQLRDFLSTCRTKRKLSHPAQPQAAPTNPPALTNSISVDYIPSENHLAPLAAYTNLNNIYPSGYTTSSLPAQDNSLGYMGHSNFQTIYPDNRFLTTDNLFHQYRPLSGYYPEYHTSATAGYVTNGFLDMSPRGSALPTYEPAPGSYHSKEDKIYACQQVIESPKYSYDVSRGYSYPISPLAHSDAGNKKHSPMEMSSPENPSPNGILTPKLDEVKPEVLAGQNQDPMYQEPRQTVLMWGTASHNNNGSNHSHSPNSNSSTPSLNNGTIKILGDHHGKLSSDGLHGLKHMAELDMGSVDACKWGNGHAGLYGHQEAALSHGGEVWQHAHAQYHTTYYPYTASQYAQSSSLEGQGHSSAYHNSPMGGAHVPLAPLTPSASTPIPHRTGVLCCPSRR